MKKQILLNLPEEIYIMLEEEAKREYRSITQQLIEILKEHYDR